MPVDQGTPKVVVLPEFKRGHEGLRALAYVLRHEELWDRSCCWDYGVVEKQVRGCGTVGCALGIARTVWPDFKDEPNIFSLFLDRFHADSRYVARFFKMNVRDAIAVFFSSSSYGFSHTMHVTPAMVADKIDAYLAEHA